MAKVGIIGGGVGGLCLAHALQRQGVTATVFERDPTPSFRRQGYRVTVHEDGGVHLKACIPDRLYQAFLERSTQWNGFSVLDKQLSPLLDISQNFLKSRSIDRAALREILLTGLPDVRFGKEFVGYDELDESVQVTFSDGSSETFDLIVGADGNQSRLRGMRLPAYADLKDTGYVDIAARLPWSPATKTLVDEIGGKSLTQIFTDTPETVIIIPQTYTAAGDDPSKGYLYWGFVARREKIAKLTGGVMSGEPLKAAASALAESFHPVLRRMIATTPPEELTLLSFFTSVKPEPWRTSRVTLIGDAVHAMPPMAGAGANTAIRDADELSRRLNGNLGSPQAMLGAVADFEAAMRDYGFAAVDTSNANLLRATVASPLRKRAQILAMKVIGRFTPGVRPKKV